MELASRTTLVTDSTRSPHRTHRQLDQEAPHGEHPRGLRKSQGAHRRTSQHQGRKRPRARPSRSQRSRHARSRCLTERASVRARRCGRFDRSPRSIPVTFPHRSHPSPVSCGDNSKQVSSHTYIPASASASFLGFLILFAFSIITHPISIARRCVHGVTSPFFPGTCSQHASRYPHHVLPAPCSSLSIFLPRCLLSFPWPPLILSSFFSFVKVRSTCAYSPTLSAFSSSLFLFSSCIYIHTYIHTYGLYVSFHIYIYTFRFLGLYTYTHIRIHPYSRAQLRFAL